MPIRVIGTAQRDILLAAILLTRLPLPHLEQDAFRHQAGAVWAYPLAGLLVAVPAALAGWAALAVGLPAAAAAGLVLVLQVLLTGAMHEDGLADSADGLWGGHGKDRRLEIMKDSATGSYAVLALILSLGLRWVALAALLPLGIWPIIAAGALSRSVMPALMSALPHARDFGLSREVGRPVWTRSLVAVALGLILAALCAGPVVAGPAMAAGLAAAGLGLLAKAKIGGQTGDILGAAQQLAEIVFLLGMVLALT